MILNILTIPIGAVLWYLGGYGYGDDGIPDEGLPRIGKAWRRYVWPVYIGLIASLHNVPFAITGWVALGLVGANSLGYGESKSWLERSVVGMALGLPVMLFYWSWAWPLATFLTFIPLYLLSLKYPWMTWGVVEAATGATQGACVLVALMLR